MGVHAFEKDENEIHLAKSYQEMFMNFVKFGEPGGGFEMSTFENSSYFNFYWNETTGEKSSMKTNFEKEVFHFKTLKIIFTFQIIKYWLKDMFEYDQNITAAKQLKVAITRSAKFNVSEDQLPYLYISMLIIALIFLTGCLVGKICCVQPRDRHLYIQLDGLDHDCYTVKN